MFVVMQQPIRSLVTSVQKNCDISDARHAGDYTLCIYLLKMREYYRWRKEIPFDDSIDSSEVGLWVDQKEVFWESLLDQEYQSMTINGCTYQPFETKSINSYLLQLGYVYGGGIGRFSKPYFFLGELQDREVMHGYTAYISGRELARELIAPPAMTQGENIFIRRESLRRMLWEKIEEWKWRKLENAMARAIEHYDFDGDMDQALERMTENEIETLILHEIGEVVAGELIEGTWDDMLLTVTCTGAEMFVRAVRDLLADCLTALPALLYENNQASLHFYFANLSPIRKELFPALDSAYEHWLNSGDARPLKAAVKEGKSHWLSVADEIMDTYNRFHDEGVTVIEKLVRDSRF